MEDHPSARLWTIAKSMARPVSYGLLPLEHARAALLATALRMEREGRMAPYDASGVSRGLFNILDQHLAARAIQREVTAMHVRRLLAPMIATRRPSNVLLAEAHGVNGAAGFPFSEAEINDMVKIQVWLAMNKRGQPTAWPNGC